MKIHTYHFSKLLLLFLGFFFALSSDVSGTILRVTTLEDTDDGVCDAHCSLREAVNTSSNDDTVIFDPSLRGGTIHLKNTLTFKNQVLTVDGPNRRRITLKGNNTFRILYVGGTGQFRKEVAIDGLIIRDGADPGGRGGGIYLDSFATLFLTDCLITNNRAAFGGGIRSFLGYLRIKDCTIANNTSDGPGGGAGIEARMDGGNMEIVNSTITGNVAMDGTGGIRLTVREAMTMINSTVVDNHSFGTGNARVGGIYTEGTGVGGIFNSIIARNTGEIPDLRLGSGYHNLIGNGYGSFCEAGTCPGSIVGTPQNPIDPMLAPLTDNGRGLPTFSALPASPAINAGNGIVVPGFFADFSTDQLGFTRIANKVIDLGSVEFGATPVAKLSEVRGRVVTATGRGVSGARLILTDGKGELRYAMTNSSGYYRFGGIAPDETVTVEVAGKRHRSSPQTLFVEEEREYLDFRVD
ncbi:MAG: carboxypeptidase regulatory-like domain-containing protein [Acidobacteria bacterium]|nr:carboxypeptidase regulatory-like domain-containing protein [Acidobacteriota bacterium]